MKITETEFGTKYEPTPENENEEVRMHRFPKHGEIAVVNGRFYEVVKSEDETLADGGHRIVLEMVWNRF